MTASGESLRRFALFRYHLSEGIGAQVNLVPVGIDPRQRPAMSGHSEPARTRGQHGQDAAARSYGG